jgi:hypothetical protein
MPTLPGSAGLGERDERRPTGIAGRAPQCWDKNGDQAKFERLSSSRSSIATYHRREKETSRLSRASDESPSADRGPAEVIGIAAPAQSFDRHGGDSAASPDRA